MADFDASLSQIGVPSAHTLLLGLQRQSRAEGMDLQALLQVCVILATSGSTTERQLQEMRVEASHIWQPYGVRFAWLGSTEAERPVFGPGPIDLVVHVRRDDCDAPGARLSDEGSLGAIRDQTVVLAVDAITRIVLGSSLANVPVAQWPEPVRDRMLGRALGRVFAHEIGHLLLGVPTHDRTGVMRPKFGARDLTWPGREHLTIGRTLIQRLQARLALLRSGRCPPQFNAQQRSCAPRHHLCCR